MGGKQAGATIHAPLFVLGDDIQRVRAIELIQFHPILSLKFPTKHFDKYLMPVAGNPRKQFFRKLCCGT